MRCAQSRVFDGMMFVAFPLRWVVPDGIVRALPFDFISNDAIPVTAKPHFLLKRWSTLFVNAFDVFVGCVRFESLHHAAQRIFQRAFGLTLERRFVFVGIVVKNQHSVKMIRHHDVFAEVAERKSARQIQPLFFHHLPRFALFLCPFIAQQTPAPTNNDGDEICSRPCVIVGFQSR